ncbi:DUF6090 family protein [Aquiflexum lacus]|uniref:DUF6090 family protein n=1 Tax=Aquiflexum lacus TaxID=2483805 RepID=UPI001895C70C|nr:DUF6090 family protein [Aquiflexum lacus]
MIKFFRKIRQRLLAEGNLKRYLIYAIGEILLVVIGILIALQINNWNEWRKDRIKEENILHDLVNEIDAEWDNHIVQNFDFVEGVGLTPNDYESLFEDHYYVSWVKAYNQGRKSLIKTDQTLIKECENVLQLIRNELKKSNSQ